MEEKIITMKSIAKAFRVDKSAVSLYFKKHNFRNRLVGVRSQKTGNRLTKALREKDAIYLWSLRESEGFFVGTLTYDNGYKICLSNKN